MTEHALIVSPFVTYMVDGISVSLFVGKLRLTADQAKARLHNLRPVEVAEDGSGIYEIITPVHFKRFEVFDYDQELSKALTSKLLVDAETLPDGEKKDKPAKASKPAKADKE